MHTGLGGGSVEHSDADLGLGRFLIEKDTLGSTWHLHLGGRASVLREITHLKRLPPFNYHSNRAEAAGWPQVRARRSSGSELRLQLLVQVLLVDLVGVAVPAVVGEQRRVLGRDRAHLHGAGGPLDAVQVVELLVEDDRG